MLIGSGGARLSRSLFLPPNSFFLVQFVAREYFDDGESGISSRTGESLVGDFVWYDGRSDSRLPVRKLKGLDGLVGVNGKDVCSVGSPGAAAAVMLLDIGVFITATAPWARTCRAVIPCRASRNT